MLPPESTRVDPRHKTASVVLHVGQLHFASEKAVVEKALAQHLGVLRVGANPVAQTATVTFDPAVTSVKQLAQWVKDCGYHCAGRCVPCHICDPLAEEEPPAHPAEVVAEGVERMSPMEHVHGGHDAGQALASEQIHAAAAQVPAAEHAHAVRHDHAGMSMNAMVRDMRNRFLVALILTVPIAFWSPLGRAVLGTQLSTPFGLGVDIWQFLLSLPVVFYSSGIFFRGAYRALRAKTLDMMVLVATAIGVGWVYSVAATFWIESDVFYEAVAFLATFVLLGHWFEMRARGGANEALRTLIDLAPPKALVMRDGEAVEIPTAEVAVGDLLLIKPGAKVPTDGDILVAVFQKGWLGSLFGIVKQPAPIMSFLPILLVGIVFGLAMDYQVFLVVRMREEHVHGVSPVDAVVSGLGHGARVVTAAALIMIGVFAGFGFFAGDPAIVMMGLGLACAILLDAFVVRMTIVPAVMALLGQKAWWLPRWLDRVLPDFDVEGKSLRPSRKHEILVVPKLQLEE